MYKKTVRRAMPGKERAILRGSSSRSRPYSSGNRSGGPRRGGGGSRGGNKKRSFFDESKFINKAEVQAEEAYVPHNSFMDFDIHPKLKEAITKRGFMTPTPIQDQAIQHVLDGRDIVGLANTGTGKTAAFLIPLVDKVLRAPAEKIIILAPTRELAIQIERDFLTLTAGSGLSAVCCVGGAPIRQQMSQLNRRYNFLVGTPGRVKDLIERKRIDMSTFSTIVLDEADRMLDMGFINDMQLIMKMMPEKRHTLFFSATLSPEIKALIDRFLTDPATVSVKTRDTAKSIDQDVVRIEAGVDKLDVLHDLLNDPEFSKVLVFGRTKHGVERLSRDLVRRGVQSESIHGDKTHGSRQQALKKFKENRVQALIATDVAARGLHIDGVTHVINYDLPETYEDYVHRIGRTGRAGQAGKALTFIPKGHRG